MAVLVILGVMVFSSEISTLLPTPLTTVIDSLKDDLTSFSAKASDSVEQRIDDSIDKLVNKTSDTITDEINENGDEITSKISETKESSQKTINEKISNFNPIESIQNIFTGTDSQSSQTNTLPSTTTTESITSPTINQDNPVILHETLSLSTTQQSGNNILLQYSDSSQKTNSVYIELRTSEKEIFSGTFFASMFETIVNDSAGIPYYVDMVVEHEDYGTVTSSVFNPGDASDSKIHGIFSQS